MKGTALSLLSVKDCFDPELPDTVISTVPANSDDDLLMITLAVNSQAVHKRKCCCESIFKPQDDGVISTQVFVSRILNILGCYPGS